VKVHIKAVVDLQKLVAMLRAMPSVASAVPVAQFQCGPFECETVEEVWGLAVETVKLERQTSYEMLREFAP
jgi:hypothetical protein